MTAFHMHAGLTREAGLPELSLEDARAIVTKHRAAISQFSGHLTTNLDHLEGDTTPEDRFAAALESIAVGLVWARSSKVAESAWTVPANGVSAEFVHDGGPSFGDVPFDEYDDVYRASEAVDLVPALGREVGILGAGICLDYAPDVSADNALAEKCADCHLFIELNVAHLDADGKPIPGIAEYDHLHRGDAADEEIISTHEAKPSGLIAPLSYWRTHGPAAMRARFTR